MASHINHDGVEHGGIYMQFAGERRHVDFRDLAGRTVTVYAQTEVVKDVIARRLADGGAVEFGVTGTEVAARATDHPARTYPAPARRKHRLPRAATAGAPAF